MPGTSRDVIYRINAIAGDMSGFEALQKANTAASEFLANRERIINEANKTWTTSTQSAATQVEAIYDRTTTQMETSTKKATSSIVQELDAVAGSLQKLGSGISFGAAMEEMNKLLSSIETMYGKDSDAYRQINQMKADAHRQFVETQMAESLRFYQWQQKEQQAHEERILASTDQAVRARQNIESQYTGWWAGELKKREKASLDLYRYEVTAREQFERQSLDNTSRLLDERKQLESSYTQWWAGELARRENASIAAHQYETKQQRTGERSALSMRDQEIDIDSQKRREYENWWKTELNERQQLGIKSQRQFTSAVMETSEGINRMARGFVLVGFTHDQNLDKLLKQLAVVHGISDAALGAMKAGQNIGRVSDAYGVMRGLGGTMGGMAVGGSGMVLAGAGAAAVAGVGLGANAIYEQLSGKADSVKGDGSPNSMSGTIANTQLSAAQWVQRKTGGWGGTFANVATLGIFNGVWQGANELNAMEDADKKRTIQQQREEESRRLNLGNSDLRSQSRLRLSAIQQQGFADQFRLNEQFAYGTEAEQNSRAMGITTNAMAANTAAMDQARGALAKARNEDERLVAEKEIAKLQENAVQLAEQKARIETQAAQIRLNAAREELQTIQQAASASSNRERNAADRLQSAKVRFGEMTPGEQQQVLQAQQMLDRGEDVPQHFRDRLRALGLEGTSAQLDLRAMQRADAAGFGAIEAGSAEAATVKREKQLGEQLNVELNDSREVVVNLELDVDRQAKRITEEVMNQFAERDKLLVELVKKEVREAMSKLNSQNNVRASERAAVAK